MASVHALMPDVVMVDPLACDSPLDLDDALRDVVDTSALIVYTSVTPTAMRRLLHLPTLAGAKLVLAGLDDSLEALRAIVDAVRVTAHRRRALEELSGRAGPLPPEVERALGTLMTNDERELAVIELARAAHMSARTLERRLGEAGAPPPTWLIRTARALLARELLCSSNLTVQSVARRLGYAKLDSLRALLRWSFDSSPSELREERDRTPGPRWHRVALETPGMTTRGAPRRVDADPVTGWGTPPARTGRRAS
jgi:AraC-like DNA-binding protein